MLTKCYSEVEDEVSPKHLSIVSTGSSIVGRARRGQGCLEGRNVSIKARRTYTSDWFDSHCEKLVLRSAEGDSESDDFV